MNLITETEKDELLGNAREAAHCRCIGQAHDPRPVVRIVKRGGRGCWLLTQLELDNPDWAWGLSDLGTGVPAMRYIHLSGLIVNARLTGARVERDNDFIADRPISWYAADAQRHGIIHIC